jgi:hypothetical protein
MSRGQELELTPEDHLRLSVLLSQAAAVRVEVANQRVVGRVGSKDLSVPLHPNDVDERYLRTVRRFLAMSVIGQPEGFPVYIREWSRAGFVNDERAQTLLKLGEPEAVAAVAAMPGIDLTTAELAWWAQPDAVIGRALLSNANVADSVLAQEISQHLFDHLAFERDTAGLLNSTRKLLAHNADNVDLVQRLWTRGKSEPRIRIAFLLDAPHQIPERCTANPLLAKIAEPLASLAADGNGLALSLQQLLMPVGQVVLREAAHYLVEPIEGALVSMAANALGNRCRVGVPTELHQLERMAEPLIALESSMGATVSALGILAKLDERLFHPTFARSTASGTLLRQKLAPLTTPLVAACQQLNPSIQQRTEATGRSARYRARSR